MFCVDDREQAERLKTEPGLVPGCPQEGKQEHICAMRNSPAENLESFGVCKSTKGGRHLEDLVCAVETTGEKTPHLPCRGLLLLTEGGTRVDSLRRRGSG